MSAPLIYAKIAEVLSSIGSISKDQRNQAQNYSFRGIDDVYNALHPRLASAKIFWVPEVLESTHDVFESINDRGITKRQIRVRLKVKYTLYAEDGSNVTTVVEGEGIDSSDKATNKALSAALKYMVMQIFCIPTEDMIDADAETPEVGAPVGPPPVKNHAPKPSPMPQSQRAETRPLPPIFDEDPDDGVGSYIFSFGKYNGKRMNEIDIHELNGYAVWMRKSVGTFTGRIRQEAPTVIKMLDEYLNSRDGSRQGAM